MKNYVILVQQLTNGQAKNMLFGADTLDQAMIVVKGLESMAVNYDTFIAIQDTQAIVNVYQTMIAGSKS